MKILKPYLYLSLLFYFKQAEKILIGYVYHTKFKELCSLHINYIDEKILCIRCLVGVNRVKQSNLGFIWTMTGKFLTFSQIFSFLIKKISLNHRENTLMTSRMPKIHMFPIGICCVNTLRLQLFENKIKIGFWPMALEHERALSHQTNHEKVSIKCKLYKILIF